MRGRGWREEREGRECFHYIITLKDIMDSMLLFCFVFDLLLLLRH